MKIQFEYFWQLKDKRIFVEEDKRIFIEDVGIHWKLKKFIVLYYFLLVERHHKINQSLINNISNIFEQFCESYSDPIIKKECYKFFFSPVDFRSYKTNFDKFNDKKNIQNDLVRKFYFLKLYPLGGQSNVKKYIDKLITEGNSINEIFNKTKNKFQDYSEKDLKTEYNDYHAEIRNYRQALSKLGILPNKEDGYEVNEISKSIIEADHYSLRAIWEEQKIKLRFLNPDYDEVHSKHYKKEFLKINDFDDFYINPYLGIIEILKNLKKNKLDPIIKFSEYKNIICREKNFDTSTIVKKISEFRAKTKKEQDSISKQFDERPKKRDFSITKKGSNKNPQEDFKKIQQNFIYGLSEYGFSKKNKLKYIFKLKENKKDFRESYLEIVNEKIFDKLSIFVNNIQTYLKKYKNFYDLFSFYSKISITDKIINDSKVNNLDKNELKNLRKKLRESEKFSNEDLYLTPYLWKNYFQKHDKILSLQTYALIHTIDNFDEKDFSFVDYIKIPKYLKRLGIKDNSDLKEIIISIKEGKDAFQNISLFKNEDDHFELQSKNLGYNLLKSIIKIQANDGLYKNDADGLTGKKKRDLKTLKEAEKKRLHQGLVMGEKRPNYLVNSCDAGCGTKFGIDKKTKKRNFQIHHLIPVDLFGPDHILNYAFLCTDCHQKINPDGHQNKLDQKKIIDNLKLNGIIKKKYYEKLVEENLIKKEHVDFLYLEKFIHLPIKLELIKKLNINKKFAEDFEKKSIEFGVTKTGLNKKRWSRPCWAVFKERFQGKIMEQFRDDYEFEYCDTGCGNKLTKGEFDCHHIIPKNQDPGFGPESPFNYAYICKSCHSDFTFRRKNREVRVNGLKQNKLVSFDNVFQMITMDDLNKNQIKYLFNEKYLTNTEYKELVNLLKNKEEMQETIN